MFYILLLAIFIIVSVIICSIMHKLKNINLCNIVFAITIFGFYLATVLYVYFDVGFYDWNFQNLLPTANVSPFMFFIVP